MSLMNFDRSLWTVTDVKQTCLSVIQCATGANVAQMVYNTPRVVVNQRKDRNEDRDDDVELMLIATVDL